MMKIQFRVAMVQALLLCLAAGSALAQDDLASRGGAAFGEYCLMPDARIERMAGLAVDRELKFTEAKPPGDRSDGWLGEWEVASSGSAWARVFATFNYTPQSHSLVCVVRFHSYRDDDRRVEAIFLELMKGRPSARLTVDRTERDRRRLDYVEGDATYRFSAMVMDGIPSVSMQLIRIVHAPPPPPLPLRSSAHPSERTGSSRKAA